MSAYCAVAVDQFVTVSFKLTYSPK